MPRARKAKHKGGGYRPKRKCKSRDTEGGDAGGGDLQNQAGDASPIGPSGSGPNGSKSKVKVKVKNNTKARRGAKSQSQSQTQHEVNDDSAIKSDANSESDDSSESDDESEWCDIDKDDTIHEPLAPLTATSVERYAAFIPIFAGPANLLNRELTGAALDNFLLHFDQNPDVINEVKKFLKNDLYTSKNALRRHSSAKDFKALQTKIFLVDGQGWEVAVRDMPLDCQYGIIGPIILISENQSFDFLNEKMEHLLRQRDIYERKGLENTTGVLKKLFEKPAVVAYLRNKNPLGFNSKKFIDLMLSAGRIRNKHVHRNEFRTEYISYVAGVTLEIVQTLGNGPTAIEQRLRMVPEEIKGWDSWSEMNKLESRKELAAIFAEIDAENQELMESLPSAQWYHHHQRIIGEKNEWASKILRKRRVDREELGIKFAKHVRRMLKGKTTEKFPFPKVRVPLRPAMPAENGVKSSEDDRLMTGDSSASSGNCKRKRDTSCEEADDQPVAKKVRESPRPSLIAKVSRWFHRKPKTKPSASTSSTEM